MKLFVGVTDAEWCRFLRAARPDEANFWQPSGSTISGTRFLSPLSGLRGLRVGRTGKGDPEVARVRPSGEPVSKRGNAD